MWRKSSKIRDLKNQSCATNLWKIHRGEKFFLNFCGFCFSHQIHIFIIMQQLFGFLVWLSIDYHKNRVCFLINRRGISHYRGISLQVIGEAGLQWDVWCYRITSLKMAIWFSSRKVYCLSVNPSRAIISLKLLKINNKLMLFIWIFPKLLTKFLILNFYTNLNVLVLRDPCYLGFDVI